MSTSVTTVPNGDYLKQTMLKSKVWVLVWMLLSIIPVLPYGLPLLSHALADTPYAYLIWIPALAFPWAAAVLWKTPRYADDGELNGILGLLAATLAGGVLYAGLHKWAHIFVANSAGLLIWPFWALAMAWMLFGVGVTRRLIKPLAYLFLAWPPLYTQIVNLTNPVLYSLANHSVAIATNWVTWLKVSPTYGNYLVENHANWLLVTVSSACSGGDSFLAMIILLPVILVAFGGKWWQKLILIASGAILSVVLNLTRLSILLASAHWLSATFTFGFLHEILGLMLFVAILAILVLIGKLIGVKNEPPVGQAITGGQFLSTPGWGRSILSVTLAVTLTIALFPLYTWVSGSLRAPITVTTDKLAQLMPQIPGYQRTLLGVYDESSVLGPGSYGTAYAYSNPGGQYAMAEFWWSYNLNSLVAYGVNNCLLFHGDTVVGHDNFQLVHGINANSFAILLPPNQVGGKSGLYEDVSYLFAVKYNGRNAYIRAEFATPIQYGVSSKSPIVHQVADSLPKLWSSQTSASPSNISISQQSATDTLVAFHKFVRHFSSLTLTDTTQSPSQSS